MTSRYNVQELAATLFEEAGDALFLFDPATEQVVDVNPMGQRLSGISRAELLRVPVTYLFRADHPAALHRLRQAFNKTGILHAQDGYHLRTDRDGVWIPVNLSVTRLHARPQTLGLITARDVREQHAAWEKLQDSEDRYRTLVENSHDLVAEIDLPGRFRYASPNHREVLGLDPAALKGKEFLAGVHPDDLPAVKAEALADNGRKVFRYRHAGGGWRWLESAARVIRPAQGEPRVILVSRDVTERKQAEALLTAEKAILEQIARGAPLGEVLTALVRSVEAQAADQRCAVLVPAAGGEGYRVEAAPGLPPAFARVIAALPPGPAAGLCGQALVQREAVTGALAGDPLGRALNGHPWAAGLGHAEAQPILATDGTALGTFLVLHRPGAAATAWDRHLIERATHVAAIALEQQHASRARRRAEQEAHAYADLLEAIHAAQTRFIADADPRAIFDQLLTSAINLTGSAYGFLGEVRYDAAGQPYLRTLTLTNIAWDDATRALYEANAATGLEFRNLATLFGAVLTTGQAVISNAPAADPRRGGLPPGHPPLDAFLGLPFHQGERLVGMIGLANRPGGYDADLVRFLQPLQTTCANLIEAHRNERRRQQAEEALRTSEQRFRRLLETASVIPWEADRKSGRFTYVGPQAVAILGYPLEDWFRPYFWRDHLHPEDRGWVLEHYQAQAAQNRDYNTEYRMVGPDERVVWFHDAVSFVTGADGQPVLQGFLVDITRRKDAEEALRASEVRFRLLVGRNLAGFFRTTWDGQILDCNPAFARIFGYGSPQEMMGRPIWDCYFDGADRERFLGRLRDQGQLTNYENRQKRKDGQPIWILENVSVRTEGGQRVIEGTAIDITERKAAEQALRASEDKYRTLVENLEQAVFLKDAECRLVAANRRYCEGVQRGEAELIGLTDFDLFPRHLAEKYRADDLAVLVEDRRVEVEEQTVIRGQTRTVRVVKTPVKDAQGRVHGVLGIYWDVTEQRALEAQLRQAQKMDAIGQLAGGVAHDFNNLLTAILGNLSLVLSGLPAADPNKELIQAAEKAALRSADLVRKLLGFSRRTMLRLEPLDLHLAIRETLDLLRPALDPRITTASPPAPDLWWVQADPGQINQVLMNLCLNARDALVQAIDQNPGRAATARLRLELANAVVEDGQTRANVSARPGEFVRLRVQDTGCGMPPDVQARIFEPFFTTKGPGKGLGLGLAMVFTIVEQHRGWLECRSTPGEGTTFDLYLPRYLPPAASRTLPAVPRGPCWGNETILLVEDEAILRHLATAILNRYGYQVIVAEDGQQAVEQYREHQAEIDLVFLDVTMPRLSGRETFLELVRLNPNVKVLFTSGYSSEPPVTGNLPQVVGFLGKPYRPEDLALTIRAVLDRVKRQGR